MTFAQLAEISLTKDQIAQYAFEAEVIEFGESGGKMDHLASVFGGIIHVDFGEELALTQIQVDIPGLIIGDSLESKQDTVGDLKMIRTNVENGFAAIKSRLTHFNHRETSLEEILTVNEDLTEPSKTMTITTIRNRDLTREALQYLQRGVIQPEEFGSMIDRIHVLMRDGLQRSTPKIEAMISAAKDAGALGCKINGSGGGGTMLAYAPGNEKQVIEAIKAAGGEPYIVKISTGATLKT
ncbi:MAG: mevalonate kinase family protein [Candidatus Heimdallarchaeota archaeon]